MVLTEREEESNGESDGAYREKKKAMERLMVLTEREEERDGESDGAYRERRRKRWRE